MTQTPAEPGRDLRALPDTGDPRADCRSDPVRDPPRDRRPGRDARADPRRPAVRRPPPPRGRPGPRQDADHQDPGGRPGRHASSASSSRRTSCRPTSSARASTARDGAFDVGARSGVRELPARRRDQPRAGQGPVRAPRGDAGAPGHDRRRDPQGARAVHRPRHGEPDRGRGHVPPARGPGGPVHAQDRASTTRTRARRRRSSPARSARAWPRARSSTPTAWPRSSARWTTSTSTRASSATPSASSRPPVALTYWGAADLESYVAYGASPRGSINLIHGARALAVLRGRRYVLPSDIAELAPDVLRHRLVLCYAALTDGITADTVIARVLGLVPAPTLDLAVEPRGVRMSGDLAQIGRRERTPARPGPGPDRRRPRPTPGVRAHPACRRPPQR